MSSATWDIILVLFNNYTESLGEIISQFIQYCIQKLQLCCYWYQLLSMTPHWCITLASAVLLNAIQGVVSFKTLNGLEPVYLWDHLIPSLYLIQQKGHVCWLSSIGCRVSHFCKGTTFKHHLQILDWPHFYWPFIKPWKLLFLSLGPGCGIQLHLGSLNNWLDNTLMLFCFFCTVFIIIL